MDVKALIMSVDLIKSVVIALAIYALQTYQEEVEPVNVFKCTPPADVLYRICCVFPPFFTREVAKECGGAIQGTFIDDKVNVTAFRRIAFDCTHWYCILDKYSLLDAERLFDLDKYYTHLDLWVSLNPMFADAMLEAKVFCKDEFRPEFPIHVCQFHNFQGCIRNYLEMECPIYIPTPECEEKKNFLKECKQYFYKRK